MAALERDAYEGIKKPFLFLPKLQELYFFFLQTRTAFLVRGKNMMWEKKTFS